jgi:hypothetical protein
MDETYKFYFCKIEKFFFFVFICFYFLDMTIPLLHFLHPNPHDNYKLEGRKAIFDSDNKREVRSLILKEGTKDLIIEVFELFYFVIFIYY